MAKQITDENYDELVRSEMPLVIDFWAQWCGPCRMITPIIDELSTQYEGKVIVGKIDVDENNDVVSRFGIRTIPTVLFMKNGEVVDKIIGATTKDVFVSKIESLLL